MLLVALLSSAVAARGARGRLHSRPRPVLSRRAAQRLASERPSAAFEEDREADSRFLTWLTASGGMVGTVQLARRGAVSGRGVVATRDMVVGELVARIPLSQLINIEHVLVHPNLGPLLDEAGGDAGIVHEWLSDSDALAVLLAYERSLGEMSQWAPWLSLLAMPANNVLTYPEEFLQELQASPLVDILRRAKRRLTETHGYLLRLPGFHGRPPAGVITRYTLEDHIWGVSTVLSRSYTVRIKDRSGVWHSASCLVPFADFFNTGTVQHLNVDCATNNQSTYFECRTTRAVRAGDELLAPYGGRNSMLPNSQLLLHYGFTMHSLKHDVASEQVSLRIPALSAERMQLLYLAGYANSGSVFTVHLQAGRRPSSLLAYSIAKVLSVELMQSAGGQLTRFFAENGTLPIAEEWAGLFGSDGASLFLEHREQLRGQLALELNALLNGHLQQYTTSLEADQALVSKLESDLDTSPTWRLHATRVRMQEKQTVNEVRNAILATL